MAYNFFLCRFLLHFALFFSAFSEITQKKNKLENFKLITVYYCVYLSLAIFVLKQHLKAMFDFAFSFIDVQCVSFLFSFAHFPMHTVCRRVVFALLF